jgi:TolB protein
MAVMTSRSDSCRPRRLPFSRGFAALAVSFVVLLLVAAPSGAAFPGANGKIAFESGRAGSLDIYTINADGGGEINLTGTPDVAEFRSAWAPDGGRVAFLRCSPCAPFTLNSDGNGLTSLPEPVEFGAEPIAWSPDGQRIAFVDNRLASNIYIMTIDGTGLRNLTQNPPCAYSTAPSWSPRGDRIAFYGGVIQDCDLDEPSRVGAMIFTLNVDGTGLLQLPPGSDPDWSPDAQKIAYTDCISGQPCGVFVMSASGAGQTRLTAGSDRVPAWSPDGTQIAFRRQEPTQGNYPNIYKMNADGTAQMRLTTDPAWDDYPTWQPLPGPQRGDFNNAAQFCEAQRTFMGESAFNQRYGNAGSGSNAFGKCVGRNL